MWFEVLCIITSSLLRIIPTLCAQNILFGKPAWQDATFLDYTADLAVDGDINPIMWDGSCINADVWWMCDMLDFYFVTHATIYARSDRGSRMDYFTVGLADRPFENSERISGKFKICKKYPHQVADGAIVSVNCTRPLQMATHVIIYSGIGYSLCFCEVEAFIDERPKNTWFMIPEHYMVGPVIDQIKVKYLFHHCVFACLLNPACLCVNASPVEGCVLVARHQDNAVVYNSDWAYIKLF